MSAKKLVVRFLVAFVGGFLIGLAAIANHDASDRAVSFPSSSQASPAANGIVPEAPSKENK